VVAHRDRRAGTRGRRRRRLAPATEESTGGTQKHAEVAGGAPQEVRSVWNDELEIHVQVGGSGPPLLFLHAAGGLRWTEFLTRGPPSACTA
jgi:hypothetical protein